mgnify:CR=1 FL=1
MSPIRGGFRGFPDPSPLFKKINMENYEEGRSATGSPPIRPLEENTMSDEDFKGYVRSQMTDAVDYIDQFLSPDRTKALEYYLSKEFGDEEAGRSQYVDSSLRDTCMAILPQLLKIFFSSERVVEYLPRRIEDAPFAEQATQYVRWLLSQKNDFFMTLHSSMQDALIKGNGFIKYYYAEKEKVDAYNYTGLDDETLASLMTDTDIEVSNVTSHPMEDLPPDVPPEDAPMTHDCTIKRRTKDGQIYVESIPPEELVLNRSAKSFDDDTLQIIAHRKMTTVSELVSMGYDFDTVLEHASAGNEFDSQEEYINRKPEMVFENNQRLDDASKLVYYSEIYIKCDYDQDNYAEWRRVCTVGTTYDEILMNEPVNGHPFINLTPFKASHDWTGLSLYHILRDIQRTKSNILRSMMDSLSLSTHPRMSFVDGEVSVQDLLNNEVGALVRTKSPNSITPLVMPYIGNSAQPLVDYFDAVKEDRTGISRASVGLDPSALQSSTKLAVSQVTTAQMQKIEMIARIFSETGIKQLFKGILRLICQHQDRQEVIRLNNNWIPINPASWDSEMDVQINVALGAGDDAQKIQVLSQIAQQQEKILTMLGPDNPLCTVQQFYNTMIKITELSGFKDYAQFWSNPAEFEPPPPPEPPPPSPEELLAEVQREQIQAQMAIESAKLQLETDKAQTDAVLEQAKIEADTQLKMMELQAKYAQSIDNTELKGIIDTQRELIRTQGLIQQARINQRGNVN